MSDAFDPYHKWLGIPPAEQPANHYRLLGIVPFENDQDVIETAADQRMRHVRDYQAGKHSALSQRILNELAAAKVCLQRPESKAAYDLDLRRRFDAAQPIWPATQLPAAVALEPLNAAATAVEPMPLFVAAPRPMRSKRKAGTRMSPIASAWLAVAVVALSAFAFVGYLIWNRPEPDRAARTAPKTDQQSLADAWRGKPRRAQSQSETEKATSRQAANEATRGENSKGKRFAFEIPDVHLARWSIAGDELVQSSLDLHCGILFGDPDWQDFDFSVEAQRTEGM